MKKQRLQLTLKSPSSLKDLSKSSSKSRLGILPRKLSYISSAKVLKKPQQARNLNGMLESNNRKITYYKRTLERFEIYFNRLCRLLEDGASREKVQSVANMIIVDLLKGKQDTKNSEMERSLSLIYKRTKKLIENSNS